MSLDDMVSVCGGVWLKAELDDLGGLFQPSLFCDASQYLQVGFQPRKTTNDRR